MLDFLPLASRQYSIRWTCAAPCVESPSPLHLLRSAGRPVQDSVSLALRANASSCAASSACTQTMKGARAWNRQGALHLHGLAACPSPRFCDIRSRQDLQPRYSTLSWRLEMTEDVLRDPTKTVAMAGQQRVCGLVASIRRSTQYQKKCVYHFIDLGIRRLRISLHHSSPRMSILRGTKEHMQGADEVLFLAARFAMETLPARFKFEAAHPG